MLPRKSSLRNKGSSSGQAGLKRGRLRRSMGGEERAPDLRHNGCDHMKLQEMLNDCHYSNPHRLCAVTRAMCNDAARDWQAGRLTHANRQHHAGMGGRSQAPTIRRIF